MAVIGASGDDPAGSAYVFRLDGANWVEDAELIAADGATGDYFGISVSMSGDMALTGAFGDDDEGESSGSAYVFELTPE